jgi:acyl carrier protein
MPDRTHSTKKANVEKVISILQNGLQFDGQGQNLTKFELDTPIADLAIDSLLLSELIFDLEDGFDIQLSDDGLMGLTASETIGDFIDTFLECYRSELDKSGDLPAPSGN